MIQPSWKDKWASIQSKFETCIRECRTAYRSDIKCKDSIEAIIADIWNLREWLKKDPIVLYEKKLKKEGLLDDKQIKNLKDAAQKEVDEAVAFARQSPQPDIEELYKDIYA